MFDLAYIINSQTGLLVTDASFLFTNAGIEMPFVAKSPFISVCPTSGFVTVPHPSRASSGVGEPLSNRRSL